MHIDIGKQSASYFSNSEKSRANFYDVCSDIGPPARMMRWCCSMFKTGPITRVLNNLYRNQQILTFMASERRNL